MAHKPTDFPLQHKNLSCQVDGGGGAPGEDVRKVIKNFTFAGGEIEIRDHAKNMGPLAAWRDAWTWRDREMFIVLEDDAELSPHWYVSSYGHSQGKTKDISGIGGS